jgi:hypothetical protein
MNLITILYEFKYKKIFYRFRKGIYLKKNQLSFYLLTLAKEPCKHRV